MTDSRPHPLTRILLRMVGHQQWLRFGIRDRIIRRFHPPDRSTDIPFVCRFDTNSWYVGNLGSFIDWSVYYFGSFCQEELDLLADLTANIPNPIALDIGANAGNHTLFLARRVSQIYAFDPFPEAIAQLRQQVALNTFNNITILPFGLGSEDASLPFVVPTDDNRGVGAFTSPHSHTPTQGADAMTLPVRCGDSALQELGLKKVSIIKIDTEGFEVNVLKGLSRTLSTSRPIVFFEWSQPARNAVEDHPNPASLFPAGYQFFQVLPPSPLFGLFTRKCSHLVSLPADSTWPLANILAMPQ